VGDGEPTSVIGSLGARDMVSGDSSEDEEEDGGESSSSLDFLSGFEVLAVN